MPIIIPNMDSDGFTLIELVIIIILLGILGVMGGDFVSSAFVAFRATDSRLEIFEEGKIALSRMEREIIHSVPNAICVNVGGVCVDTTQDDLRIGLIAENDMISDNVTGRYQGDPVDTDPNDANITETSSSSALSVNSIVSINNLSWDDFTNTILAERRLYEVNAVNDDNRMVLHKAIPIGAESQRNRYYAVDKAVRYFLDNQQLRRAETEVDATTDFAAALLAATSYPLATDVTDLDFTYSQGNSSRSSVVTISLEITKDGEVVRLEKEVHARNTP